MIEKDDLALIAHCIAVANNHSAPDDYVKLVVDAGFPFEATAAMPIPIVQAPELHVIDAAVPLAHFLADQDVVMSMSVASVATEPASSITIPLVKNY